jgi:uncharacterized flavoprotein (TIGR03862 family)
MIDVCVIGAGPAGLMAAEVAADNGFSVLVIDAKPSFGRKFLMAGKSGLNLTKNEPFDDFMTAFGSSESWLMPMLSDFSNDDVISWAKALGQEVFTGTSSRVFPISMKASPLLRAWLFRLANKGVQFNTRWRWLGWEGLGLRFQTSDGIQIIEACTSVLALGGASWPSLGSDGAWAGLLTNDGINLTPFKPANMGFVVPWSDYMKPYFGRPVKTVSLTAGETTVRGDFVISSKGVEGSAIYAVSQNMREGAELIVDLLPDTHIDALQERINRLPKKSSRSSILRKALRLDPTKAALFNEFNLNVAASDIARAAKTLPIKHLGPRPIAEAISTAGGVPQSELTEHLMLHKKPSVFCAGEMLEWEAPTGGYLITGCLATGMRAGKGAVAYLRNASARK